MRATQLVQEMTVAEKVGQLVQTLPSIFSDDEQDVITGPIAELLKEDGITPCGLLGTKTRRFFYVR